MKEDKAILQRHVKWYISFAFGAVFGALVFISLYGINILNVTYDDWLLTGWYDLSQHYVGWKLYRASMWHFPPGLCDTSLYPYLASVIYTDSIPLVCLFFKILSPVLPETFQFFGLYGLFCFMMQGGVSKLLLRRVMKSEAECCIACIPFLFCAPLWQRMYYHTALASHYLILLGIMLFMYRDRVERRFVRVILWCVLGMLCISIHFTIYGIISVMISGFALWETLEAEKGERIKTCLSFMVPYLLLTISVFWFFGGFYGHISGASDGLGAYSANLNSLFNPLDYSRIIKEQPLIEYQYEGLSYIGIMAILLFIPAATGIARNFLTLWKQYKNLIITMLITSSALWIIALSPKAAFGTIVLYDIPVSGFIYNAWSLFRASGRFLWPVMYCVILLVLYFARNELKSCYVYVLVAGCLLQLFEFSDKAARTAEDYAEKKEAFFSADSLDLMEWNGIKHLQFMHDYYFGEFYGDEIRDQMIGYTEFALRHGMTVSNFHFSRDDMDKVRLRISECEEDLSAGDPEKDTIYVFRKEDISMDEMKRFYSGVYNITTDNEIIAVPEK